MSVPEKACPAVSVVIPAWNVSGYIAETLNSVFNQTFTPYEIIVVNDGAPDTAALEALAPYRTRIVYISQNNQGPGAARNTAIRAARGSYIALLDGDDLWEPQFLQSMLQLLSSEQADLVYCDTRLFGDHPLAGYTYMDFSPSDGPCTLEALITCTVSVCTSTVVMVRSPAVDAGLFDVRLRYSEDFDLWTRMALNGVRIAYSRAVLGYRRLHGQALSSNQVKLMEGMTQVYGKLLENPQVPADLRPLLQRRRGEVVETIASWQARQCLRTGDVTTALQLLRKAGHANTWKGRLAITLLSTVPKVVPALTRWWDALLAVKQEMRSRASEAAQPERPAIRAVGASAGK